METILAEIERALNAQIFYPALVVTLTLPDICAALEAPNGRSSRLKYIAWYDAHVATIYPLVTAIDCYSIRCGVVHQGKFGHPGSQYSRVIFTLPDPGRNTFHKNIINDALNLDPIIFCRDMISIVRLWYEIAQSDPIVQKNLPDVVQVRLGGIAPYIVGLAVIS